MTADRKEKKKEKEKTLGEQKVSDIRKILRADTQKLKSVIKFDVSNWIIITEKAKIGFFARASPAQGAGKR